MYCRVQKSPRVCGGSYTGAAYRGRLIVVALHTVNSALSSNPFALRMRRAYKEEAHLLMMSSTWEVIDKSLLKRIPRILSCETRSIPVVAGTNITRDMKPTKMGSLT